MGRTARRAGPRSRGSSPLHGQKYPREEGEWATRDGRWERGGWPRKAGGPQLEGCHWEAWRIEDRAGDVHWEPGRPPTHWEPPGAGEGGPAPREGGPTPRGLGGLPELTPELGRVAAAWAAGQASELSQWVAELWRAADDKRATLVALRQSEETLQQVWQWMGPLWPGVADFSPARCPSTGGDARQPSRGGPES